MTQARIEDQKRPSKRLVLLTLFILSLFGGLGLLYERAGQGAMFLASAGTGLGSSADDVKSEVISASLESRELRVLVMEPVEPATRMLLVAHGVHDEGIDHGRFQDLCREMARAGFVVVAPELDALCNYDLSVEALHDFEAAARWALSNERWTHLWHGRNLAERRTHLMGISFGGGIAVSAAARPILREHAAAVLSFGGHGDLGRTMRFLAEGEGDEFRPHVYGQAVLLRRIASRLLKREEVEEFRNALSLYLQGEDEACQVIAEASSEQPKRLLTLCLERNAEALGEILAKQELSADFDPALSPICGEAPKCPVFLLHGEADNVIPPSEARGLAKWAGSATTVHCLVSDQIIHVEFADEIPWPWEFYALSRFLEEFLEA